MTGHRGFVLLVVVSVLGVIAVLGVSFAQKSRVASDLSVNTVLSSRARLLARSGIETGLARISSPANLGGRALSEPISDPQWSVTLGAVPSGSGQALVSLTDANAGICLNDGLTAGRLELGSLYDASATDPWPTHGEDVSALINVRLRRLLNAYGDARRFVDTLGWPVHTRSQWDAGQTGNFGSPFSFTGGGAGDRYASMPGLDGLGDRIVSQRPAAGYRSWNQVQPIIDLWGKQHGFTGLFEVVQEDLNLAAWEDTSCFRLNREFGPDRNGDGYPDFENDFTVPEVPTQFLDSDPPDLTGIWRPHAVAPVHLNRCSDLVRAAVFYAPVNVSYVCEGVAQDWIDYPGSTNIQTAQHYTETLGTGGPVFEAGRMTENGHAASAQKNRLVSLRDALVWARSYREIADSSGYPASFNEFRLHLRALESYCPPLERPTPFGGSHTSHHLRMDPSATRFTQRYLEFTLPHLLGCQRRLPGWMQAPVALMSPYIQQGGGTYGSPLTGERVLRSVEDFVWRMPHPKVRFVSTGRYTLVSEAEIVENARTTRHAIRAMVEAFETRVWRSQKDFMGMTSSMTRTIIGPEPSGVSPSPFLGVIGPKPHAATLPGTVTDRLDLLFEGDLSPEAGSTLIPENSVGDPWLSPGSPSTVDIHAGDYPVVPGMPFNGTFLNHLRQDSPDQSQGETWLIPRNGYQVIQEFTGGSISDQDIRDIYGAFFQNLGLPVPTPGSADEWDRYVWLLCTYGVIQWNSPLVTVVSWAQQWSNGEPGGPPQPDNTDLANSGLEGANTSMFLQGSQASDLSPFGGVTFSGRGHGARAVGVFNDSLYLRPYRLLNDPDVPGRKFNKGLLSCWVRVPSGYVDAFMTRCVSHATFWENIELKSGSTIAAHQRPLFVSVVFRGLESDEPSAWRLYSQFDRGHGPIIGGSYGESLLSGDHQMDMTLVPYPADQDQARTPPQSWSFATPRYSSATLVHPWQDFYKQDEVYSPRAYGVRGDNHYGLRAGGWVRVLMRWDTSQLQSLYQRHRFLANADQELNSYQLLGIDRQVSFNGRMLWAFGECPRIWRGALSESVTPAPLDMERMVPCQRLNSTIDDIRVFFGETGDITNPSEIATMMESDPSTMTTRYWIVPGDEPSLDLNMSLPPGSHVLMVGARVFDVPYETDLGDPAQLRWPRVDLDVIRGGMPLAYGDQSQPDEDGKPRTSAAWRAYDAPVADSSTRLRLTWRAVDPSGQPLNSRIFDAPWVEEVSVRFSRRKQMIQEWVEN